MSIVSPTTYLDFVQRSAQECRIASLPTSTVSQTGQALDFCLWVNEAWREIQTKHPDWWWMLQSPGLSFNTIQAQAKYTPTDMGIPGGFVSAYKRGSFRYYKTSTGITSELQLEYVEYEQWRRVYQINNLRIAPTVPLVWTITPQFSIGLNTPLAGYTVTGEYFRAIYDLSGDSATVDLPQEFRMLLVYSVMMKYAAPKENAAMYTHGEKEFNKLMTKMEARRRPEVEAASALA